MYIIISIWTYSYLPPLVQDVCFFLAAPPSFSTSILQCKLTNSPYIRRFLLYASSGQLFLEGGGSIFLWGQQRGGSAFFLRGHHLLQMKICLSKNKTANTVNMFLNKSEIDIRYISLNKTPKVESKYGDDTKVSVYFSKVVFSVGNF